MPKFEVRCYRTTAIRAERVDAVDLTVDTASLSDAQALAASMCRLDRSLPWAPDPDAPETSGEGPATFDIGETWTEKDGERVKVSEGTRPYPIAGTVARPADGQGAFSDEQGGSPGAPTPPPPASRELVKPPPGALTGGPKVALPPYDPAEERRAAAVADLLTQDVTGQPVQAPIGLEPSDPKELQNDAPGAHGQPIPLYEPWRPSGADHLLDAKQREAIRKGFEDAYDARYPGERLKQESFKP